jgi:lipopolysaccharide biosynthesis protein
VCPWWDNTARRKSNSVILANSSPLGYQRWLYNAIQDSIRRLRNEDERLIFVNAWNEWAEGAYLEPDQIYGYAYLEATRMAIVRSSINTVNPLPDRHHGLAVIIHAFYPEVLPDILNYMSNYSKPFKLFITTSPDKIDAVKDCMTNYKYPHMIIMTKNKGRDVLPFLIAAKHVISQGYKYFLKIHTKKSTHRADGDHWRNDIYNKLLNPSLADSIGEFFIKNRNVGIVGPDDHIVPMVYYWGSNKERVMDLSSRLGINPTRLMAETFVAGTMFYARFDAVLPLLNLAISADDFEEEKGQVDGTLAHAIERIFTISAVSLGMKILSTHEIETGNHDLFPTTNYAFADATLEGGCLAN